MADEAEGHSFRLANNVILMAYSWAYDKFKQALDRVHRMNSVKPVNVYVVLCTGSIDRRLESLVQEKADAAELVLDGRLIGERTEEVNLAELLTVARREFNDEDATLDEGLLQAQWLKLRQRLDAAMNQWIDPPAQVEVLRAVRSIPVGRTAPDFVTIRPPVMLPPDLQGEARTVKTAGTEQRGPLAAPPLKAAPTFATPQRPPAEPEWKLRARARFVRIVRNTEVWASL